MYFARNVKINIEIVLKWSDYKWPWATLFEVSVLEGNKENFPIKQYEQLEKLNDNKLEWLTPAVIIHYFDERMTATLEWLWKEGLWNEWLWKEWLLNEWRRTERNGVASNRRCNAAMLSLSSSMCDRFKLEVTELKDRIIG